MRALLTTALAMMVVACSSGSGTTARTSAEASEGATAEEAGLVDKETGCAIPNEFAYLNADLSWDGPCLYGLAIGKGTLRWTEADGSEGFYRTCLRPYNPYSKCSQGGGG